jgi:hypothetical protein
MHRFRRVRSLRCALLILSGVPAWARSQDEASTLARRQNDGRVLSVNWVNRGASGAWRVTVLALRGEVQVIFIEAGTSRPR